MPRSLSGRIVVDIDPELKTQLYAKLESEGMTLKDWFVQNAHRYLFEDTQLAINFRSSSESRKTAT